jgi:hypothetical protein
MIRNVAAALIFAAGLMRAADDLTPLDLKPGLWETTTVSERSGAGMPSLPPDKLAQLPPEQRARIEAMTASKPTTTTTQSCRVDKDLRPFTDDRGRSCKQTVVTSTSTKQEMKMDCTMGANSGTGTATVEAKDSEHVNGLVVMHMGANGRTMDMKVTINAKWISSSCGDVKPAAKQDEF